MHTGFLQRPATHQLPELNPACFDLRFGSASDLELIVLQTPSSSTALDSVGMTKHPRDGGDVTLSLSLALGGEDDRAKKQPRRVAVAGEFVCKTCSRAFPSFQALGGHRTSHLRGRHGLALGLAAASTPAKAAAATTNKAEKPAAAASHECHFCGAEFEMGQALGGHMRRHREEAAATAQAPPVLLQLFV